MARRFIWIQNCQLGTSYSLFNCGFIMIIDDIAKWLIQRLAKRLAIRVRGATKGDGTLPPSLASSKPAFGWTPVARREKKKKIIQGKISRQSVDLPSASSRSSWKSNSGD